MIDLGDAVPLAYPTRPYQATTVTVTISQPDGTIVGPVVALSGSYTFTPVQVGRHGVRWQSTSPTGSDAYADAFDVQPADPSFLISLADLKAQLKISQPESDDELRFFLESTTELIEDEVGPVLPRPIVESRPLKASIVLSQAPVAALTSITTVGYGLTPTDVTASYLLDSLAGVVTFIPGSPVLWTAGDMATVSYTAGRPKIPAGLQLAARLIAGHLWDTKRGAGPVPARGGQDQTPLPGSGVLVPDRAAEAMIPFMRSSRNA